MMKTDRAPASGAGGVLTLRARDVTGTRDLPVEVDPGLRVSDVADQLVDLMSLPRDTPWALRDDRSASFLDDSRSIGEQVTGTEATLTVTPRTHLG